MRQCSCRPTPTDDADLWPRRPVQRPPRAGAAHLCVPCVCAWPPPLYRDVRRCQISASNARKNSPQYANRERTRTFVRKSHARFTLILTPHSCGTEIPLKHTHKNKSTKRGEVSPGSMHHGDRTPRTRPNAWRRRRELRARCEGNQTISGVDHAWYVTCFDCSSMTDERLARAEFREEVAGLPS